MSEWQTIGSAPIGEPILFANFTARCLLCGAPHVWAGRLVPYEGKIMMLEASYAATHRNGEATHWAPLPTEPTVNSAT